MDIDWKAWYRDLIEDYQTHQYYQAKSDADWLAKINDQLKTSYTDIKQFTKAHLKALCPTLEEGAIVELSKASYIVMRDGSWRKM